MAEQTLLAKLGLRLGVLGSSASLAFAAPLATGDFNITAATAANRIGVYFDRTVSSEAVVFNVMGTDRVRIGVTGIEVPSGSVSIGVPFDASTKLNIAAGTTAYSSIRMNIGVAPTTPVNGDMWFDGTGFFMEIGGAPMSFGAIGGTATATQVSYGLSANTITSNAAFTYTTAVKLLQNIATATAGGATWQSTFFRTNWASSGSTTTSLIGSEMQADTTGTGTNAGAVVGAQISAFNNNSSGTLAQLKGFNVAVNTASGSTTSALYGGYISATVAAGHTATTAYGLYVLTNYTGTVGTKYGIYQDDATALNYFTGVVGIGIAPIATTYLNLGISTTAVSSLRMGHGAPPTVLVNGDFWTTTAGFFGRISANTYNFIGSLVTTAWPAVNAAGVLTNDGAGNMTWGAATAGIGGSATATQVSYGLGPNTITSNPALTYDSTALTLQNLAVSTSAGTLAGNFQTSWASSGTTATSIIGLQGKASQNGTGNNTNMVEGIAAIAINNNSAGTLFQLIGLRVNAGGGSSGATTTNAYGIYSTLSIAAGHTSTNAFGLYVGTSYLGAVTNKYGIYQDDSTALNYFFGNTGVGIAPSPSTFLNLGVSTTGVSSLRMGLGVAPTVPVNGDLWMTSAGLFGRFGGVTVPYGSAAPAGANTQVQFNNSGAFGASPNLTWSGTVFAIVGRETITNTVSGSPATLTVTTSVSSSGSIGLRGVSVALTENGSAASNISMTGAEVLVTSNHSGVSTDSVLGIASRCTMQGSGPTYTGSAVQATITNSASPGVVTNIMKGVEVITDSEGDGSSFTYGLHTTTYLGSTDSLGTENYGIRVDLNSTKFGGAGFDIISGITTALNISSDAGTTNTVYNGDFGATISAASVVDNFYGLRSNANNGGTITGDYVAIYLGYGGGGTAGRIFGIYQPDAIAQNYLNGVTGIGTLATAGAWLALGASTSTIAHINFAPGATKTAALGDGDVWFDGTNFKARIGGVTKTFTIL